MRLKMASLRFCDDSIISTALRSRLEQDLLESIATQILVKFVILKHAAAWKSRPHPVLIATSLSAPAAAPAERLWFSGRMQLECTANGNLSGSVRIGSPVGEQMQPVQGQGGLWIG